MNANGVKPLAVLRVVLEMGFRLHTSEPGFLPCSHWVMFKHMSFLCYAPDSQNREGLTEVFKRQ